MKEEFLMKTEILDSKIREIYERNHLDEEIGDYKIKIEQLEQFKINMIKSMLEKGIDKKTISEIAKLPVADIEKL
jgi:hypothetical protein